MHLDDVHRLQHPVVKRKARTSGERSQPRACIPRNRWLDARAKSNPCCFRSSIEVDPKVSRLT